MPLLVVIHFSVFYDIISGAAMATRSKLACNGGLELSTSKAQKEALVD